MAVALIVAAGSGERLGADRPKALVVLAGRPLVEWAVAAARAAPGVEEVVVALPPGAEAPEGTIGVPGGETRSHSVRAALAAASPTEAVVVHDAARPLAGPDLFAAALEELERSGADATVAAARVSDTVKRTEAGGRVVETLDRSALWAVQTPQAFRTVALARALDVSDEVLAAATDDAWLVERAGGTVRVVEAPRENVKVTTPVDLRLAELLLAERSAAC